MLGAQRVDCPTNTGVTRGTPSVATLVVVTMGFKFGLL